MATGQAANDKNSMNEQRIEELRQDIKELLQKFDNLAHLYVLREMFLPWQQNTDRRISVLEETQRTDKQWANDEHSNLANQVVESERRIIAKIDSKHQWKLNTLLYVALAGVGWLVGIIEFLHPFGLGK